MCTLQVRSVTLDTWLPSQVAFMAATGNAAANAHYEAQLDPAQKPSYYSPDLDAFIRRKVSCLFRLLLPVPCIFTALVSALVSHGINRLSHKRHALVMR